MMVTLQMCNDKGVDLFRHKFMQTTQPESRVHYLAATFQLSAALQRIAGQKLSDADTILLIAPALFGLIEYCNRKSNILTKNLPLAFAESVEVPIDNNQAVCLARDDGTLDNKTLRSLQLENLQYMNTAKQLPLCPGIVRSHDLQLSIEDHAVDKENIHPIESGSQLAIEAAPLPPPLSPTLSTTSNYNLDDIDPDDLEQAITTAPAVVLKQPSKQSGRSKGSTKEKNSRERTGNAAGLDADGGYGGSGTAPPVAKHAKQTNASQRKDRKSSKQQQQQRAAVDESVIANAAQQSVERLQQQQQQQQVDGSRNEVYIDFGIDEVDQGNQESSSSTIIDDRFENSTRNMIEHEINQQHAADTTAGAAADGGGGGGSSFQLNNNNKRGNIQNSTSRSMPLSHRVKL